MRLLSLAILIISPSLASAAGPLKTENVLFVMFDGLRWQDVFTGAEEELLNKERGGIKDVAEIRKQFWRETAAERREVLMPFTWGTIAKSGQLFGNQSAKSVGTVTNQLNFSYPGYNEVLCGFADPLVISNSKINNRNTTVLEWLHQKPTFQGKVAAFGSWEVFPYIINSQRSGIPVNAGLMPLTGVEQTDEVKLLNRLTLETPLYGEETRPDALTYHAAKIYLKAKKPRVLFLSFDETDAQGHAGRYDRLLAAAHKNDAYVKDLWDLVQSMPEYRGKTTLILTTDHGRGGPPKDWQSHGAKIKGAESWWVGILGPDTPPLGERKDLEPVTQTQVASTIAALLGQDYLKDVPKAGAVLPGTLNTP